MSTTHIPPEIMEEIEKRIPVAPDEFSNLGMNILAAHDNSDDNELRRQAAIRGAQIALEKQWIDVNDRLPELTEHSYWIDDDDKRDILSKNDHVTVLAINEKIGIYKAEYDRHGRWSEISSFGSKTTPETIPDKWMPLPAPPQTNNQ